MENDLIDSLAAVGFNEKLNNVETVKAATAEGVKSPEFRSIVVWIANEIKILGEYEEEVRDENDINTFLLELSGLLKELRCPHTSLITGHVTDRLQTKESRILLLDFLITELMGLKMYNVNKPKDTSQIITIHETPIAAALKDLTISLSMGKPPENISPKMLFDKIASRVDEVIRKAGPKRLGKPLFNPSTKLTIDQWRQLEKIQKDLDEEYDIRRKMMLARLDVTVQSFQWSDRLKGKEDDISKEFTQRRKKMDDYQFGGEDTNISALLAARENLAIIEKTSNSSVRKFTQSKIQRIIIGQVPDRGGRAYEHAPPPPEMPTWTKRDGGGGRGGGRGGFGGGDRGGRGGNRGGGRGGFNSQQSNNFNQSPFSQSTGGFQSNNKSQSSGGFQSNNSYQQPQFTSAVFQPQPLSLNNPSLYDNRGGNRVQGGWSQKGSNQDFDNSSRRSSASFDNQSRDSGYSSRNDYDNNKQDRGGGNFNRGGGGGSFNQSNNRGGSGDRGGGRGRSSYNRGGGGGRF